MAEATVRDIYNWIDSIAPFETQEAFDNAGLIVGGMDKAVTDVYLALDATPDVIREARKAGAQLLLTHHPLIFHPIQRIDEDTYEGKLLCALIRGGITMISAHTNMDKTAFSGSARAARLLGLQNMTRAGEYLFLGDLERPVRADALEKEIEKCLGGKTVRFGRADKMISRLAVAGGAYSEGINEAMRAGADALLTGEVRHHHALEAEAMDFPLYEGGHYHTEAPMLAFWGECLQNEMNRLQYNVRVHVSPTR